MYNVILADPPWSIKAGRPLKDYKVVEGKQIFNKTSDVSRSTEYTSMTIEEIMNLDVESISAKDSHLYLWVTNKHLPHAFKVIESWGFKYSTTIVWAKNMFGGGLGGAFKINTEYLLFATKGNLKAEGVHKGTWHNVKREYVNGAPKHSKKPSYFYELIEKVSPGNKIELFARNKREGWDSWGNEVESNIELNFK